MSDADCTPGREPRSIAASSQRFVTFRCPHSQAIVWKITSSHFSVYCTFSCRVLWKVRLFRSENWNCFKRVEKFFPLYFSIPSQLSTPDLRLPSRSQTTVESLGPVWLLCQGTGTVRRADHVTPGSGPLNSIHHHSTLVCHRLSSSAESSSLEHARRNDNVQHRTSHMMMMMMTMMGQVPQKRTIEINWSSFLQAGCPSCRVTNSVKSLKETSS